MDRTTQKDIHMKNINRDMYTETNLQTKSMKKITRRMDNVWQIKKDIYKGVGRKNNSGQNIYKKKYQKDLTRWEL